MPQKEEKNNLSYDLACVHIIHVSTVSVNLNQNAVNYYTNKLEIKKFSWFYDGIYIVANKKKKVSLTHRQGNIYVRQFPSF